MKRMTYKNTKTPIRKNRVENGEKNNTHSLITLHYKEANKTHSYNYNCIMMMHNYVGGKCIGLNGLLYFVLRPSLGPKFAKKQNKRKGRKNTKKRWKKTHQFGPPYPTLKNMCVYSS